MLCPSPWAAVVLWLAGPLMAALVALPGAILRRPRLQQQPAAPAAAGPPGRLA